MKIIFSQYEGGAFLTEIITSAKSMKKIFKTPEEIFDYLKEEIPLSNAEISINTTDANKKIVIKNTLDKILKYQKNNGITLQYIIQKNRLKKMAAIEQKSGNSAVLNVAGDTAGVYNSGGITKENLALYGLYAEALINRANDLLQDYTSSDERDYSLPANALKSISDIILNLNNLIKNEFVIHKNVNLISLRNHFSKILLRYEEHLRNKLKPAENETLNIIKKMNKTRSFSGLEKYLDLLFSPSSSEDLIIELVSAAKYSENVVYTTKLIDLFNKTDNIRIKEHIVWAIGEFKSPNLYKFLKELLLNQNEAGDVRIAASLALANYPDPPKEIVMMIEKLRAGIINSTVAQKKTEIKKLPYIIISNKSNGDVYGKFSLKSLTSSYFKFYSDKQMPLKEILYMNFEDEKIKDIFNFSVEIVFSVFNEKLGVYINRGKFLKEYSFEKEQIQFLVNNIKNDNLDLENYFISRNQLLGQIFPCKFHPDFPYKQKNNFFSKYADDCMIIMNDNFYLDTGFEWDMIKCPECKKKIGIK